MIVALCIGCATEGASRVNEYVDAQTGVSIRSMASPFVYAVGMRESASLGDYISIGAVEVNRMGARQQFLAVVLFGETEPARTGNVTFTVGGQPHEFTIATREPSSLGISQPPFRPPWGYLGEIWYVVTPAELRAFAAAPPDSIELIEVGRNLTYFTLDRADAALRDFISDIPEARMSEPQQP